jgi:Kae1-associated kinase Bud32
MEGLKKISEGAESELYLSEFAGTPAVVKARPRKMYRIEELDESIRSERTKREARLIATANENGVPTPHVFLVGKYDITMELIEGDTLSVMMRTGHKSLSGIIGEVGRYLGILHSIDISHGDFTPANIMVSKDGVVHVIDFGLGDRTKSIEDKSMDLLLMKRSLNKQLYSKFLDGYRSAFKLHKETIERLAKIERRGRYNARTIATG